MIDHGPRICVIEKIEQFLFHIAVVHVEGCAARLEGTEHTLEILVAVVEVERNVILARLPVGELRPLCVATQAVPAQDMGQPARTVGDLRPTQAAVAIHDAVPLGNHFGDGFMDTGQIHL